MVFRRAVLLALSLCMALPASAKCRSDSDPLDTCGAELRDWLHGNADHQTQSPADIDHRTHDLRDTLQNCFDCAVETIVPAVNQTAQQPTDGDDPQ
jgi:hypothetical protein